MTVLRPLEFVNFPSKDAMEAIFCIIFARVFLPIGTALYQMVDVGFSSGVRKKNQGTVSPLRRCERVLNEWTYPFGKSRDIGRNTNILLNASYEISVSENVH